MIFTADSQIQYPSGRTLVYTPDSAGRITSVQNKTTGTYYANGITYNQAGGILTIPMGNGLTETDTWNDRGCDASQGKRGHRPPGKHWKRYRPP